MRIFVYGTLLDPAVLASKAGQPGLGARLSPALLAGHRRALLRGSRYPTLRRDPGRVTEGAVAEVPAAALRRLSAYEGPRYRLCFHTVGTPRGTRRAAVWIAPGAAHVHWPTPA